MTGIKNEEKGLFIGYSTFPDRKKPAICVMEGNRVYSLGTFTDEKRAQFFIDKLYELLRIN